MKKQLIKKLASLANYLDKKSFHKEADEIDKVIDFCKSLKKDKKEDKDEDIKEDTKEKDDETFGQGLGRGRGGGPGSGPRAMVGECPYVDELATLASYLDEKGLHKEADEIGRIIKKAVGIPLSLQEKEKSWEKRRQERRQEKRQESKQIKQERLQELKNKLKDMSSEGPRMTFSEVCDFIRNHEYGDIVHEHWGIAGFFDFANDYFPGAVHKNGLSKEQVEIIIEIIKLKYDLDEMQTEGTKAFLTKLVKLANNLDEKGLHKEADEIDKIINEAKTK